MNMSMSLRMEQRQELSQAMTQDMKQLVQQKMQLLLQSLTSISRQFVFRTKAECPNCGKRLTQDEIMKGFLDDPKDITTSCPRCNSRFPSFLSNIDIEMQFFCPIQTLDRLKVLENDSPLAIFKKEPAIFRSAYVHFGSLHNAFKEIGIGYKKDESTVWLSKAKRFLGLLPDVNIAEAVSLPVEQIRKARKDRGIPRATKIRVWKKYFGEGGYEI